MQCTDHGGSYQSYTYHMVVYRTTPPQSTCTMTENTESTTARSEKEKMLRGELYQAFAPELVEERQKAKEICFAFNQTNPMDKERRQELLHELLGRRDAWVESPFHIDYGYNTKVGESFYANHGCTILDANLVTIGDRCLLAPSVCISAATHPLNAQLRSQGWELTAPITIGHDVWLGANVTICPGVTMGNNVVVAAGAVVTKGTYPSNVVLAGVPAKIVRQMDEETNNH